MVMAFKNKLDGHLKNLPRQCIYLCISWFFIYSSKNCLLNTAQGYVSLPLIHYRLWKMNQLNGRHILVRYGQNKKKLKLSRWILEMYGFKGNDGTCNESYKYKLLCFFKFCSVLANLLVFACSVQSSFSQKAWHSEPGCVQIVLPFLSCPTVDAEFFCR